MTLSILIPTTPDRKNYLDRLLDALKIQIVGTEYLGRVEILEEIDNYENSVGTKRNKLLSRSVGDYVCFIDDDDRVSEKYISLLFVGIHKGVDCCSLKGIITENGLNPLIFEHSIKYNEYKTNENTTPSQPVKYERYPNHLNCIKASIAKQFRFPEINHGEDTDWARQIHKSGLIKTEHYIPEIIYYYDWRTK